MPSLFAAANLIDFLLIWGAKEAASSWVSFLTALTSCTEVIEMLLFYRASGFLSGERSGD